MRISNFLFRTTGNRKGNKKLQGTDAQQLTRGAGG